MPETTKRLFIALNLSAELRGALHDATATLRAAVSRQGRWVAPDNLHLTLKFLGDCPVSQIARIEESLAGAASASAPARLGIAGVGAFPNIRRPRVVWIGVEPDPKLELLQHDVETACAALGYQMEGRPFRPHITLGRIQDAERTQLRALARAAARVDFTRSVEAQTLDVMLSEPAAGGSRYTVLAALPLGGGGQ